MKIVADENIPHAAEAFGEFGEVLLLPGRGITRAALADAEILVVRSITNVDSDLLEGTPVRFVGTATNGLDHIDLDYLHQQGLAFADAGGANADAVAQYVLAALLELRARGLTPLTGEKLGIVGVGRIGERLARRAALLGMEVIEYDPPRALNEPGYRSASREDLFNCAIISFHVPLNADSEHDTRHMVDAEFLERLHAGAIIINSSRGAVVDSAALLQALRSGHLRGGVLDVWEGEPSVPTELMDACTIATPHIAAYSYDAKLKGTDVMAQAVAVFLGRERRWRMEPHLPAGGAPIMISGDADPLDAVREAILSVYDIRRDNHALRELLTLDDAGRRAGFDRLRKDYPVRREFQARAVACDNPHIRSVLAGLGFRVDGSPG